MTNEELIAELKTQPGSNQVKLRFTVPEEDQDLPMNNFDGELFPIHDDRSILNEVAGVTTIIGDHPGLEAS